MEGGEGGLKGGRWRGIGDEKCGHFHLPFALRKEREKRREEERKKITLSRRLKEGRDV